MIQPDSTGYSAFGMHGRTAKLLAALLFPAALMTGCGSTSQLTSAWKSDAAAGDSSLTGIPLTELKDSHLFVGIQNDKDFVYVRLMAPDQQFRRQMVGPGLTLWFESEEGKKLGIQYPMGVANLTNLPPPGGPETANDPEEMDRREQQVLRDLQILGPGDNDRARFSTLEVPGIRVHVGHGQGSMVYDLKVPLRESADHPYALGSSAGSVVKLEIQTGKFDQSRRDRGDVSGGRGGNPAGGEPPEGGMPGGGGFGGGRRGGGRSGGGRSGGGQGGGSRPDPLDLRAEIHLAGSAISAH